MVLVAMMFMRAQWPLRAASWLINILQGTGSLHSKEDLSHSVAITCLTSAQLRKEKGRRQEKEGSH